MANLYHKVILQHVKQPQNYGSLRKPTQSFDGANPFCGDEQHFEVELDKDKKIIEVAWNGKGCAISKASASIFSDMIRGKKLSTIQKMKSEKLLEKLNLELSPTRIKCALMPLYTVKKENLDD